jgi:hypothetical protein
MKAQVSRAKRSILGFNAGSGARVPMGEVWKLKGLEPISLVKRRPRPEAGDETIRGNRRRLPKTDPSASRAFSEWPTIWELTVNTAALSTNNRGRFRRFGLPSNPRAASQLTTPEVH